MSQNTQAKLEAAGQKALIDVYNKCTDEAKKAALLEQVEKLDANYTGGILAYVNNGKRLLKQSKDGVNIWEGWNLEVPTGYNLTLDNDEVVPFNEVNTTNLLECKNVGSKF